MELHVKNIQKTINKLPANWPITRNVVKKGVVFHPVLNEGDVVKCYFCNKKITVNNDTAFRVLGDPADLDYIECPECGKRVASLYYFSRKVLYEEPKKTKKKPRRRSRYYVDDILGLDPDGEL